MLGAGGGGQRETQAPPPPSSFTSSPSWSTLSPTAAVPSTGIGEGRGAGHHHSGDTSEGLGCELQEGTLRWRWISNSEHWLHN